jgi:hypothetical protein
MLDKFGPDVIKTAVAAEKYAQENGYWPKKKEWNQYAAQHGFYSTGTLIYWGLWDYFQQAFKSKIEYKLVEEVSIVEKSISEIASKQSVKCEKRKSHTAKRPGSYPGASPKCCDKCICFLMNNND